MSRSGHETMKGRFTKTFSQHCVGRSKRQIPKKEQLVWDANRARALDEGENGREVRRQEIGRRIVHEQEIGREHICFKETDARLSDRTND